MMPDGAEPCEAYTQVREALVEARAWLAAVEKQLLSENSQTLKPLLDKIDTALSG
jgi:hypothetical protein